MLRDSIDRTPKKEKAVESIKQETENLVAATAEEMEPINDAPVIKESEVIFEVEEFDDSDIIHTYFGDDESDLEI